MSLISSWSLILVWSDTWHRRWGGLLLKILYFFSLYILFPLLEIFTGHSKFQSYPLIYRDFNFDLYYFYFYFFLWSFCKILICLHDMVVSLIWSLFFLVVFFVILLNLCFSLPFNKKICSCPLIYFLFWFWSL